MGRNVDLVELIGAPEEIICEKCSCSYDPGFYDYDVDYTNPQVGNEWHLKHCCLECGHDDILVVANKKCIH